MPDLVGGGFGASLDERRCGDDLARRAEAALEGVCADERVDQRMFGKALDRRHLSVMEDVDEGDAGENRHAVELDRAGAAVPFATGDLHAGQAEVEPQRVGKRAPDGRLELVGVTVDRELDQLTMRPASLSSSLSWPLACSPFACFGRARLTRVSPRGCPQGGSAETSSG